MKLSKNFEQVLNSARVDSGPLIYDGSLKHVIFFEPIFFIFFELSQVEVDLYLPIILVVFDSILKNIEYDQLVKSPICIDRQFFLK